MENQTQSRRAVTAAVIGNMLEWYDFAVYAYVAVYIAKNFFPHGDPVTALLATFLTYGLGFVARPLGGIISGRVGDTHGRKTALLITIALMAIGTVMIGILPTYATIGVAAPLLLLVARLLQGFSAGGEWGSSTAYIVEWAPAGQRGWYGSFQQTSVVARAAARLRHRGAVHHDPDDRADGQPGAGAFPSCSAVSSGPWACGCGAPSTRRRPTRKSPPRPSPRPKTRRVPGCMAGRAFGFTIVWTVCFYVLLNYLPTWSRHVSQDQPGGGALGQHHRAVRADALHTDDGQAVGQVSGASRCCLPAASPTSCCPTRSSDTWLGGASYTDLIAGADPVRDPDLDVLGAWTGGDRRNLPDALALDLDDVRATRWRSRSSAALRLHLGVAHQHLQLADRATGSI